MRWSWRWRYFRAVLRHKRYVFEAGRRRGVPLWQLVVHDWSKFLPWEFEPYASYFNGYEGGSWAPVLVEAKKRTATVVTLEEHDRFEEAYRRSDAFLRAFLFHLHLNPHHHQYWRLPSHGSKEGQVFEMPERYAREMVADWDGAGRAYNGEEDTANWYSQQTDIVLHQNTRVLVERLLGIAP